MEFLAETCGFELSKHTSNVNLLKVHCTWVNIQRCRWPVNIPVALTLNSNVPEVGMPTNEH